MQTRLIGGATYFTREHLEATNPSRREGIDAVAEARWRSTTSKLVKTAIKTLKLPDWVYETSMNYINRFFLTRSISKNDRHLVVGGAILLASKVQESPRPVQDVAYVLLQLKNANKQKPQHGPDQTTLEQFMEGVVLAEQAILFSLNFNLNVETHVSLARRLLEPLDLWAKANPAPEEVEANQLKLSLYGAVMFFLNDSALTNLSLQHPNSKIAPVALIMAAKRIAATRYGGKEFPSGLQRVLALSNNAEWLAIKGLSLDAAADVEAQINELYATSPAQPTAHQQRQHGQMAQPQHAASAAAQHKSELLRPQQSDAVTLSPESFVRTEAHADEHHDNHPSIRGCEASTLPSDNHALAATTGPASSMQVLVHQAHNEVSSADDKGGDVAPQRPSSPPSAGLTATTPCCRQGYLSSSAAAVTVAGTTAGDTPELPHTRSTQLKQQSHCQPQRKRVSDGDECTVGEQQATSELHAAPEQQPEAEAGHRKSAQLSACPLFNGLDDSANENCSPNGLTTGNASGSGCGVAEGHPEVSSRTEAHAGLQSQPTQPQASLDAPLFDDSQSQFQGQLCGKRGRGDEIGDELVFGHPVRKGMRLEESQPVSVEYSP